MRKIRRVYMTLALAVLLAGMTACGNNTTNDTGKWQYQHGERHGTDG